jgi:hypothetical protein
MKAPTVNPGRMYRTGSAPNMRSLSKSGKAKGTAFRVTPSFCWKAGGINMDCLICKDLERALESRRSAYVEARAAAYYRVSTELAAKKNVDMERAKSDLEEHQLVCFSERLAYTT